jgi:hypothetical protein
VFTEECRCSSRPYRVGKIYTFPLSIDIDDWLWISSIILGYISPPMKWG